LTQLFQNFTANAIKFFCGEQPPETQIKVEPDEDSWRFSVQDNGIGISSEYFDRILVLFQRLHSREAYSGAGIGLAICKKIVEHHGGRIWIESTSDQGSTFHFTIPQIKETQP
jgi:light-regulated signal transduction histidine kinase (bacteriophytochrome)